MKKTKMGDNKKEQLNDNYIIKQRLLQTIVKRDKNQEFSYIKTECFVLYSALTKVVSKLTTFLFHLNSMVNNLFGHCYCKIY